MSHAVVLYLGMPYIIMMVKSQKLTFISIRTRHGALGYGIAVQTNIKECNQKYWAFVCRSKK